MKMSHGELDCKATLDPEIAKKRARKLRIERAFTAPASQCTNSGPCVGRPGSVPISASSSAFAGRRRCAVYQALTGVRRLLGARSVRRDAAAAGTMVKSARSDGDVALLWVHWGLLPPLDKMQRS